MINMQTNSPYKPDIAVLYHLARTGGTLISKCLGAIDGNVLLSEIHPLVSVMDPLTQASQWFHLLSEAEREAFLAQGPFDYLKAIQFISERARARDKKLIIRDWTHIDYTAVPFVGVPSYQLTQTKLLQKEFTVHQFATVRHPIDSWLSVSQLKVTKDCLPLEAYLVGCRQFARAAKAMGFVRFEDFCVQPHASLKQVCDTLQVNYSDDFIDKFWSYRTITGEVGGGRLEGKVIKTPSRKPVDPQLLEAFSNNNDYWVTLELLGYSHP